MSIAIIINPISGGAAPRAARARAELRVGRRRRARRAGDVFVTERRGHARELARRAVARGARLVIAWGGDGTINEVASALAFSDVPLGIVPAGSGNGLARELGVDPRPERAIAEALARRAARDRRRRARRPAVRQRRRHRLRRARRRRGSTRWRGAAAFSATSRITARALVDLRAAARTASPPAATRVDARALLVTVANSAQFGNGARIAPGARLDDGLLDLVVVEERSRAGDDLPAAAAVQRHRRRGSAAARSGRSARRPSKPTSR